jgi:RNA polymerase sigma-70 factor (ECF subfamily)
MDLDALIQRAKANDQSAFDVIYRTYHPKMVRICTNIVKEDREAVEDLVHDAFVMAFVSLGSLKDNSKFNEWLTSIVRNVALKHIEQRDRVRVLPISDVEDDVLTGGSSPESDLNHKELLGLISQLPEGYRKILRLYVIEGFSHKEIADMLGIEPHSSSSQLARAKRLLRRMLLGAVAVLLIPLAWYLMLREEGEEQDKVVKVDMGDDDERTQIIRNASDSVSGQIDVPKVVPGANLALQKEEAKVPVRLEGDSVSLTDTAIVTLSPKTPVVDDVLIAETIADTLGADMADSMVRPVFLPEINIAEIDSRKNRKWQLLAAGSLGPALVQNVYNLIAINTSLLPEIEGSLGEMPSHVSTWEEYCKYLKAIASENASADTLQLIQIAEQNSGKIVHKEHHDKPITFGISVTKSVSDRLSLETGLQYSILKSRFTIGEGGDSAATRQKIHYLGVPLRVSYKWVGYKRLSAYSSVGATLHVPVYSKLVGSADNDWKRIIFGDKPLNPSLQWQVGASVGVQYEFAPNTSLFVEPTVNWFIPSGGETHTIWTEQPVMFTCPFGIRITW